MERYLIARHFLNNEGSLIEFEEQLDKILPALELLKEHNLNFGLKLTTDDEKLTNDLKERITQEKTKLPSETWFLYDPKDRGPGTSFRQIIFNPTFGVGGPYIITCTDLDQFPMEREFLEPTLSLIEKVEKDGSLYAVGSRDIPIKLAIHERNSNLRIIHELFHSLAIGSEKLIVKEAKINISKATPAYKKIGESTTGEYIFNTAHENFTKLMNKVYGFFYNSKSFATEYYTVIKSSLLGGISTGYIPFRENKFYEEKDEDEELKGIKRFIERQTAELGRTDISDLLLNTLKEDRNKKIISEFYDKNDVEIVRDLMMKAILSQN